ncbi:hypothetical protein [Planococcus salinus]|uniref:Uncharacterized protein n=1 Tax=Planococcus salinus TaxID=1848460 RepID=A0A3M8P7L1_9BACL|nr:hypothetical protein [Planococcus salinus]RNF39637.1 hypothetical protein EEX84_09205 [Planococcus salinus]
MKRHWKKIVLLLGIVLLSTAGYLLYLFQFKEYDVADKEVDDITKEEYNVELPDGSTIILDKEGNVVENGDSNATPDTETASGTDAENSDAADKSTAAAGGEKAAGSGTSTSTESANALNGTAGASSEGSSSNGSSSAGAKSSGSTGTSGNGSTDAKAGASGSTGGSGSGSSGSGSSNSGSAGSGSSGSGSSSSGSSDKGSGNAGGSVTVAQIKQKYEPALADVEAQANSRISGLVGRAKAEYTSKKASGESISYSYFYSKYTSAAAELENRTDAVFYAVLGSMKQELKANGLAESHADSFVSEYENRKEQRKNDLMKQATGF